MGGDELSTWRGDVSGMDSAFCPPQPDHTWEVRMQAIHGGRYSILVVDDDPVFCDIMKELLKRSGFEVRVAYHVEDALQAVARRRPDLILTDVMMPEIDGLCLVRRLRADPCWASIPTVVVSARVMEVDQDAAADAGADGFLEKPFSFDRLQMTIESFLPVPG
jgi:CheY-like chemotaxis protein